MELESLFHRYGYPSDEMNERICLYFPRPNRIKTLERVQKTDKATQAKIKELLEIAEVLKEYRQLLYKRAQQFFNAEYAMRLSLTREVDGYPNGKKTYVIKILKLLDLTNADPVYILNETYEGKERHKALKRFEELKKLYPNIETIIDIDKKSWER
ncbi:MAG: hypothetical protein ACI4MQ_02530 [Candidatus Coproplasma sp.]